MTLAELRELADESRALACSWVAVRATRDTSVDPAIIAQLVAVVEAADAMAGYFGSMNYDDARAKLAKLLEKA